MSRRASLRSGFFCAALFEVAAVFVCFDHVARGIVNASVRFFGHASRTPMHHETICRSMIARSQRETARLVHRAQQVLGEFRKLLEQREMHLKQQGQFLEQRARIADEIMGDTAILSTAL